MEITSFLLPELVEARVVLARSELYLVDVEESRSGDVRSGFASTVSVFRGDACNFGDARRSNAGDASNRGDACEHGEVEGEGFSTAGLGASTGTLFFHAGAGVVSTADFSEQEEESSSEEEDGERSEEGRRVWRWAQRC